MGKLEERIYQQTIRRVGSDYGKSIEACNDFASEVKDIAIAFALHYAAEDINMHAGESWNHFITNYYK